MLMSISIVVESNAIMLCLLSFIGEKILLPGVEPGYTDWQTVTLPLC